MTVDAVTLEVLRHAMEGVADEMGGVLKRTAYSPNIKEREDCSAAVFSSGAELVAQAEHIPVHLGSMPASVDAALRTHPGLARGDQVLLNDPFSGGTHLNDLTLVSPVFTGDVLLGYVANRAHHTDVGGIAPGSIPAGATDISQEGVRIPPVMLYRGGVLDEDTLALVTKASRTPDERIGDLLAQGGANARGATRLAELAAHWGTDVLVNAGCWRVLRVVAPEGTVVNARPPAAVGAGNVEGSQRICDAIFGAFALAAPDRVPAASQGTMNNLLIGGTDASGRAFSYYETIAGGQGGTPWSAGASAVHTNMTNTLNTPVEALEHAYPLRARRYEIREGSGGRGRHDGGDGVVREVEVLASDATVTLITERRSRGPWGVDGGEPGAPGRNAIDGEELPAKVTRGVEAGAVIRIETPGGGGWGK